MSVALNPQCRYCGQYAEAALAILSEQGLAPDVAAVTISEGRCPIDGHIYPPLAPDCRACAGACLVCEQPGGPSPCPACGFAG